MLVYFECFNTVQIAHASLLLQITHACLQRIFQNGCIYLHFIYNNIYISYMHSPQLISIIKCHHHRLHWQCILNATLQFQQQFVLDETPLQMDLIRFSSNTFTVQF